VCCLPLVLYRLVTSTAARRILRAMAACCPAWSAAMHLQRLGHHSSPSLPSPPAHNQTGCRRRCTHVTAARAPKNTTPGSSTLQADAVVVRHAGEEGDVNSVLEAAAPNSPPPPQRRLVRRVARRTVYGSSASGKGEASGPVWSSASSPVSAVVADRPVVEDGPPSAADVGELLPGGAPQHTEPVGVLAKLRASAAADRELSQQAATSGDGSVQSLADTLRAKFKERRERSMARIRAQFRARSEDEEEGGGGGAMPEVLSSQDQSGGGFPRDMVRPNAALRGMANTLDWRTLQRGEYVVHKDHGIGKFVGAKKAAPKPGQPEDVFLFIEYGDGMARLRARIAGKSLYRYRPAMESNPTSKTAAKPVKLSRLDDPEAWRRKRQKGIVHIQKLVMNIMNTYFQRVMVTRSPYPEAEPRLLAAFQSGFPYPLTVDQQAAISDIYDDMSRDTPMDRLIIGDVGFGKTEVALHAALRALSAGFQVAILAPTTVLARQHAALVETRFKPLGFTTAAVTRFTSASARQDITAKLRDGTIRLVVGTHALLNEVQMCPSLGLLIVDEEQRFGVRQKEVVTSLLTKVDVLTMSATPIPRTLHMAMAGFRDASVIATPPPGRLPVHTQLLPASDQVIRDAIRAELSRKGQVFYVVPRIDSIDASLARLKNIVPEARVLVAHGRMRDSDLEEAMTSFADGNSHDVMLCTTIVESGLDLPRVNTILIEDAYMFGLASLYQLRGRVGRCALQAYALLMWDAAKELTEDACARLEAIRESCGTLGGGFLVAERDMQIRGVGEICGDAQSGETAGIGPDMFLEVLHQQLVNVEQCRLPALTFDDVSIKLAHLATDIPPQLVASEADARQLASKALDAGRQGAAALKALSLEVESATGARLPNAFRSLLRCHLLRYNASAVGIHTVQQGPLGEVHFRTAMDERTFGCIAAMMADVDKAQLTWRGDETGTGSNLIALRVDVPSNEAHSWGLQPDMLLERAISATGSMLAAAPTFLRYN
jgi:Helicase conserved C-terminal domain/DEAD/DEAH box helicase/CarD-like/TRCF domain